MSKNMKMIKKSEETFGDRKKKLQNFFFNKHFIDFELNGAAKQSYTLEKKAILIVDMNGDYQIPARAIPI